MIINKPSASQLERAMRCLPSSFLPIRVSSESEQAERGTNIHEFIDRVIQGSTREEAIALVDPEYRDACNNICTEFINRFDSIQTERSYGVDFVSGEARFLGDHLSRNYPELGENEHSGTADIIALDKDTGNPVLADIKSGKFVSKVENNWQLKFLAYALHKVHGYNEIDCYMIYVREDDEHPIEKYTISGDNAWEKIKQDLNSYSKLVHSAFYAFDLNQELNLKEGTWCQYCPCLASCPAKVQAIKALADKAELITDLSKVKESIENLTPEQAKQAWYRYKNLKAYWELAEKSIRGYAKSHGIELDDGWYVRASESTRSYTDSEKLLKIAKERPLTDEDLTNTKKRTKFTKIVESRKLTG